MYFPKPTVFVFAIFLCWVCQAEADDIGPGTTSFQARAIQDVTLFANTALNDTDEAIIIDDLFGDGLAGWNREQQSGNSIEISSFFGWAFEGSLPGLGDYRFGIVGSFTGDQYSGTISNVVQDPSDPGFSNGDPSSFVSGDLELLGPDGFGFEFTSGPLAGVFLTTDPSQNFSFTGQLDGLPPSPGTTFFNGGEETLNVLFNGVVVGTSSDRRIVVSVPEPGSGAILIAIVGLAAIRRRKPDFAWSRGRMK